MTRGGVDLEPVCEPHLCAFQQDIMHYEQLKAGVIQHDLLVDNLIYKVSELIRHTFYRSEIQCLPFADKTRFPGCLLSSEARSDKWSFS